MKTQIIVKKGDITKLKVDAIVNAANKRLLGGGGVDGAIHRAGGKEILKECIKIGGCEVGEAVITTAGNLDANYVIHTVGPIWRGGNNNEEILLQNAYKNSLKLAINNGIKTIAFPNISTGIYRFPKKKAAEIALKTIKDFIKSNNELDEIIFVCYNKKNFDLYNEILSL